MKPNHGGWITGSDFCECTSIASSTHPSPLGQEQELQPSLNNGSLDRHDHCAGTSRSHCVWTRLDVGKGRLGDALGYSQCSVVGGGGWKLLAAEHASSALNSGIRNSGEALELCENHKIEIQERNLVQCLLSHYWSENKRLSRRIWGRRRVQSKMEQPGGTARKGKEWVRVRN